MVELANETAPSSVPTVPFRGKNEVLKDDLLIGDWDMDGENDLRGSQGTARPWTRVSDSQARPAFQSAPCAGSRGLERSGLVGQEASGPGVRRSSPCPALPSVAHPDQGVRGEGALWPRGFMAETTVCSLSCTAWATQGAVLHTSLQPPNGVSSWSSGAHPWAGGCDGPISHLCRALRGLPAPVNPPWTPGKEGVARRVPWSEPNSTQAIEQGEVRTQPGEKWVFWDPLALSQQESVYSPATPQFKSTVPCPFLLTQSSTPGFWILNLQLILSPLLLNVPRRGPTGTTEPRQPSLNCLLPFPAPVSFFSAVTPPLISALKPEMWGSLWCHHLSVTKFCQCGFKISLKSISFRIPSSSGNSTFFPLKAFNWLDEAHPYYGR